MGLAEHFRAVRQDGGNREAEEAGAPFLQAQFWDCGEWGSRDLLFPRLVEDFWRELEICTEISRWLILWICGCVWQWSPGWTWGHHQTTWTFHSTFAKLESSPCSHGFWHPTWRKLLINTHFKKILSTRSSFSPSSWTEAQNCKVIRSVGSAVCFS